MSISNLNHFPMATATVSNTIPHSRILLCMVEIFLLHEILIWVGRLLRHLSLSRSECSIESQFKHFDDLKDLDSKKKLPDGKIEDGHLRREDVEKVMVNLGIFCNPDQVGKLEEKLGFNDFSKLFEEKEPSLDEVKEAFDVFDENRDGFIDERELHRVLCILGVKEGLEMEKCRRMICAFDENGDGRIEFREFIKIMENTFC